MTQKKRSSARRSGARKERAARRRPAKAGYLLRLFVTGASSRSARAIANIKAICESQGSDLFVLEVVDIYQQPELARSAQLVASPTLLKTEPLPERRMVGDLSDHARVLAGLGLVAKEG